ncbi:MAG TPA: hypothetical protein VHC19_16115 [Pirellulales bacterium]|nr:hypothetical protein [Pirellulales bacterium]
MASEPNAAEAEDEWIRLATSMANANVNVHDSPMSHGVAAAFNFHRAGGLNRAVLQARLLAGESSQAIAAKMGMQPEAVDAYEALLYSVRDRLAARDWIASRVLGMFPWTAESRADKANLVRLYGYNGGPLLVDLWAAYFAGASLTEYGSDDEVRASLDLLVRLFEQPVADLASTLKCLADFQRLLKTVRRRAANATETPNNPLPLDLSAAIPSEFHVIPDFAEPAQTQVASTDAA